jgi:hypothetical protein
MKIAIAIIFHRRADRHGVRGNDLQGLARPRCWLLWWRHTPDAQGVATATAWRIAQSTKSGNTLLYPVKKATGATTLAEKREKSMWGLIIASGVCGLLFGRYFKMYALIPATLVLAGIAYFLASKQGLAIGVLSLVLAMVAMQLCYFLSVVITVFMDNFEPAKAPSEEFL